MFKANNCPMKILTAIFIFLTCKLDLLFLPLATLYYT